MSEARGERWQRRLGRVVVSVATVAVAVWGLETLVGIDAVVRQISTADRSLLPFVVAGVAGGLVTRGAGLWVILRAFDRPRSLVRSVALVPTITFVNRLAPSGQAGGSAANGAVAVRFLQVPYEVGLATVVSAVALNNVIILSLALVGAGYLAAVGAGGSFLVAAATAGVLLAALAVAAGGVWRYPDRAQGFLRRAVDAVAAPVGRLVPGLDPSGADVEERLTNVREALGRLVRSPWSVVAVMTLQTGGRLLRMAALWVALLATGLTVSPVALLVVVPIAMGAAVIPVPGGGGGVEATLVALLVGITGFDPATLTAGVLLFRGISVSVVAVGAAVGSAYALR